MKSRKWLFVLAALALGLLVICVTAPGSARAAGDTSSYTLESDTPAVISRLGYSTVGTFHVTYGTYTGDNGQVNVDRFNVRTTSGRVTTDSGMQSGSVRLFQSMRLFCSRSLFSLTPSHDSDIMTMCYY